jgi:hypothetical protein
VLQSAFDLRESTYRWFLRSNSSLIWWSSFIAICDSYSGHLGFSPVFASVKRTWNLVLISPFPVAGVLCGISRLASWRGLTGAPRIALLLRLLDTRDTARSIFFACCCCSRRPRTNRGAVATGLMLHSGSASCWRVSLSSFSISQPSSPSCGSYILLFRGLGRCVFTVSGVLSVGGTCGKVNSTGNGAVALDEAALHPVAVAGAGVRVAEEKKPPLQCTERCAGRKNPPEKPCVISVPSE